MDPQAVLEWIANVRAFVDTHSETLARVIGWIDAALQYLISAVPAWFAACVSFIQGMIALVRSVTGS